MPNKKQNVPISIFSYKKINSFVRFLTLSDFLMNTGFGLIAPIFAIYIMESIQGANIETVGIATTIFFATKSMFQIPVGNFIDKHKGEKDDFWLLLVGMFIYGLIPLSYIFIDHIWQLYLVQFIFGIAASFAYPSWMAIFSRHLDKKHEGIEWGMYATFVEIGMAFSAAIGGFIAYSFGFVSLFVLASILIFIGNLFIFSVASKVKKR